MWRNLLLGFIMLTQLDGSVVWVDPQGVQIIRTRSSECGHGAGCVIRIGATTLCVKETADEVRSKIDASQR